MDIKGKMDLNCKEEDFIATNLVTYNIETLYSEKDCEYPSQNGVCLSTTLCTTRRRDMLEGRFGIIVQMPLSNGYFTSCMGASTSST